MKIPDIPINYDKVGSVLRNNRSYLGNTPTFTTAQVYALYKNQYPDDEGIMEERKKYKPTTPGLKPYLNGYMWNYCDKTDGRDPDRPAIEFRGKMTYRFASNLISDNGFSKEDQISHRSLGDYLPNEDDFESAYRQLCSPGQKLDEDSVLDQIEKNAIKSGYNLKEHWRLITKRNIQIWVIKAEPLDPS